MPDAPAETAPTDAPETEAAPVETATVDLTGEVEKWKAQARKQEERAKSNATAARELETLKASMMSDTEKAIAEAKAEARAEAFAEAAVDLVDSALAATAAGRLSADQLAALTTGLDRKAFIGDDGKVDTTAIQTFVDGIAPAAPTQEQPPPAPSHPLLDLGQGTRGAAPALNSDALTQAVERAVGLRR